MKHIIVIIVLMHMVFLNKGFCQTQEQIWKEIDLQTDLNFVGTAVSQRCFLQDGLILTETYFNEILVIFFSDRSVSKDDTLIRLVWSGGTLNGETQYFPGIPDIRIGRSYLMYIRDDGLFYPNPFPGGCINSVYEIVMLRNKDGISISCYPPSEPACLPEPESHLKQDDKLETQIPIGFMVYPNPVKDFVRISNLGGEDRNAALSLYDFTGQVLIEKEITQSLTHLDISHLVQGVYFLRLSTAQGDHIYRITKYQ